MSPVLISPVRHIRMSSFTHRRARSIILFVTGYAAIWLALGSVLIAIEVEIEQFASQSHLPAAGAILIALVWQFSPIKQRCLNRCHAVSELAVFGVAADFDAFRFGVTHGIWCAGSCWALMLLPMLLPQGHVVAMASVGALIFSEFTVRNQPLPPSSALARPRQSDTHCGRAGTDSLACLAVRPLITLICRLTIKSVAQGQTW